MSLPTPATYNPRWSIKRKVLDAAMQSAGHVRRKLFSNQSAIVGVPAAAAGTASYLGRQGFNTSTSARGSGGPINELNNYNITSTKYKKLKKRKGSKKARRKAKKFKSRVLNIVGGYKGLKQLTFQSTAHPGATTDNNANYRFLTMIGNAPANTTPGANDLREIIARDGLSLDTATLRIHGFYAKIMIRNEGASNSIIDIYEITNKKPLKVAATTMEFEFNNDLTATGAMASSTAWLTATAGVSNWNINPFVNNLFLKKYEVLTRRTIQLKPNDYIEWEVKKGKQFKYDAHKLEDTDMLYQTSMYMIVVRGYPTQSPALSYAQPLAADACRVYYTRTFSYTRETAGVNSEMDPASGRV